MGQLPKDAIGIEVDGAAEDAVVGHVSPESLANPVATLRLAVAYLDLLEAIAADRDQDLVLRGLEVIDKCTAVFARVNVPDIARQCAAEAARYLGSPVRLPRGIHSKVEAVHEARAKLPPQYKATAFVGSTRRAIERATFTDGFPAAKLQVRATPIRVGGKTPSVTFESPSEEKRFTLRVVRDQAKQLAPHLYTEVDIEALVLRADDGLIEGGDLEAFYPLDDGDPMDAWGAFVRDGRHSAH
jgi:hypothetical protein